MRKIITAFLLLVMSIGTMSAQRFGGPYIPNRLDAYDLYYGFRLGCNTSSIRFSNNAIEENSITAMNFGFIAGFPLGNSSVIFEPGILYSVKGGKLRDTSVKSEVFMHGIEIPLVLKYDIELPTFSSMSLQPFFGGFFNLGMGGKIKCDNAIEHKKFKTYADRYKRLDAGMRMGCGLNLEFFYLELAYDLGLADLGTDSRAFCDIYPSFNDWDDKVRTGNLSISFGVNF